MSIHMESAAHLNIGDKHLRLCLDRKAGRLRRGLLKHFNRYLTGPAGDGVRLCISGYDKKRNFDWSDNQITSYAGWIKETLARLPHTHPVGEREARVLEILRHIDPHDTNLQQMNCRQDESLLFGMVGEAIFLYKPRIREAAAFLPKTLRVSPMLADSVNAVMFVLSQLLADSGGLLLHGCAVERDGVTVLFIGRSGSGKTTMARLCRPDTCFADDGVVVVRQDNQFMVHSSPFCQIEETDKSVNGHRGTIQKILLLEKQSFDRVSELEKHAMMRFMLQHAIHFFKYMDDGSARKGFETVRMLLQSLPTYRLQFTRYTDVWNLIP